MRKRALGIGEPDRAMIGDGLLSCSRIELVEMISRLLDERKAMFGIIDRQETDKEEAAEEYRSSTEGMTVRYEERIAGLRRVADEAMVQLKYTYHALDNLFIRYQLKLSPAALNEVTSRTEDSIMELTGSKKLSEDEKKRTDVLGYLSKHAQKFRGSVERHLRQGRLDLE